MDREIRRAKIFNYTVAIIFLLIFISIFALLGAWKWNRTFTVSRWMDNPNERYKIVSDMLSENEIIGMTENEIIDLLGNETESAPEKFKHPRGMFPNENNLTYGLGVDYMDYEWLVITMEKGIAVDYVIGCN